MISLTPALLVLAGIALSRAGATGWRVGYRDILLGDNGMSWAWLAALVGAPIALFSLLAVVPHRAKAARPMAFASVILSAISLAALYGVNAANQKFGLLHDVATDWKEPILFSDATLADRGAGANPVEAAPVMPANAGAWAARPVAEVNAATCKAAQPLILNQPLAQAFAKARQALTAQGLKITLDDEPNGRLEAMSTSPIYRFQSDVAVRVRQDIGGARLDLRSTSRLINADLGANCRQITRLLGAMRG